MAAGRVCTGFSLPYVAKYAASEGTITYSGGRKLARGVSFTISPEASSDNKFYADNVTAETDNHFTGGTFNGTVDGFLPESEKFIAGLPEPTDGWYAYGDNAENSYFGFGFIARYMSDGVTTYVPYVLAKVSFDPLETTAETQEEEISWQTQAISGSILRGDDTNHNWKFVGIEYQTEAAAEAALKSKLGIS